MSRSSRCSLTGVTGEALAPVLGAKTMAEAREADKCLQIRHPKKRLSTHEAARRSGIPSCLLAFINPAGANRHLLPDSDKMHLDYEDAKSICEHPRAFKVCVISLFFSFTVTYYCYIVKENRKNTQHMCLIL